MIWCHKSLRRCGLYRSFAMLGNVRHVIKSKNYVTKIHQTYSVTLLFIYEVKTLRNSFGQSSFSFIQIKSLSSRILSTGHHNITLYNLQHKLIRSNQIHQFTSIFIIDANYNVYSFKEGKTQIF